MKTIEQIQSELTNGTVFTYEKFFQLVGDKYITPYDGSGYYHDGENKTNISVWDMSHRWNKYPYVVWVNK